MAKLEFGAKIVCKTLEEAVAELGFRRKSKLLYTLQCDEPGVEKYLEFRITGGAFPAILCDFGLGNAEALGFAVECLKAYGGAVYTNFQWPVPDYNVHCQIGRFCRWGILQSLDTGEMGLECAVETIVAALTNEILPRANTITDLPKLCSLFISDHDWMPWLTCNGAMRAAECVYLMRGLGHTQAEILQSLEHYILRYIKRGIWRDADVRTFVGQIVEHGIERAR